MAEKIKGKDWDDMAVATLRDWQSLERDALEATAKIMETTDNPVIRQIMEIIRMDSMQHHRVQQFIIDTLTKDAVTLTREDVGSIWEAIEKHDEVERKTIGLAKTLLENCRMPVQKVLLEYLLTDEEKHDKLLMHLNDVKKGMARGTS